MYVCMYVCPSLLGVCLLSPFFGKGINYLGTQKGYLDSQSQPKSASQTSWPSMTTKLNRKKPTSIHQIGGHRIASIKLLVINPFES